jgi:sarcosine oxidase
VVGAGVLGLSAAVSLAERDVEVVVLEAATPGHALAGSKGSARIFRLGYPDPLYVEMAAGALEMWHRIENETGLDLLEPTGQLSFGPEAAGVAQAMAQAGLDIEPLSQEAVRQRFPDLHMEGPAFFEPDSGVLRADDCLRALHSSAPFTLRSGTPVLGIEDMGNEAIVRTTTGLLSAEVVVDCAGHDSLSLLNGVKCPSARPPTLQQVAYFTATGAEDLPVFIEWGADMFYGLPVPGHELYKLAQHVPGTSWQPGDDAGTDDPALLGALVDTARRLLPGVDPTPVATERCLYDNTLDGDFILDRIGRVVVACGTSGHGFKFAPLLGELVAHLAMGMPAPIDLTRFSLARSFLRAL